MSATLPKTSPSGLESRQKLELSLRYWILGRASADPRWLLAHKALELARSLHTGMRKDGITPSFQHQLEIAQYLRTLAPSIMDAPSVIAVALLHDTAEDFDELISFEYLEREFGATIASAVQRLTKKYRGSKMDLAKYLEAIALCPIASLVKGADRINNLQSMLGVFSIPKQREYALEAQTLFLPMLKAARRRFPEQEPAYENIKMMMRSQLQLLKATWPEPAAEALGASEATI